MTAEPLLVVILGPTGSGKTALALTLAEHFHGEIVNCDSVAMYREFEIGTAKPTPEERTRVPHHLIGVVSPDAYATAGEYAARAREALAQIKSRGRLPIVVGGTGLYLRALLDGLFPGPQRSEELRERLRRRAQIKNSTYLHRLLKRLDAAAAQRIHPNDGPKLVRAIEVCLASRRPMTEAWKQGREPLRGFRILRLGLNPDRSALYTRLDQRAQRMLDAGLIEETRQLLGKYGAEAWPFKSLGYKQAGQYLRGQIDRDAMLAATRQAHRNYAKRQMTWFRREPEVTWLAGFGEEESIRRAAVSQIEAALVSHA